MSAFASKHLSPLQVDKNAVSPWKARPPAVTGHDPAHVQIEQRRGKSGAVVGRRPDHPFANQGVAN